MTRRNAVILTVALVLGLHDGSALTIHRSFRPREAGVSGFAGVSVPVDAKVAAAIDEARAKEAERPKVYVGRVTRVLSGDELFMVTGGGTLVLVRLDGIAAPDVSLTEGRESTEFLRKLVQGRQVRVEYRKRDDRGYVLGVVTVNKADVNQKMVAAGMARKSE